MKKEGEREENEKGQSLIFWSRKAIREKMSTIRGLIVRLEKLQYSRFIVSENTEENKEALGNGEINPPGIFFLKVQLIDDFKVNKILSPPFFFVMFVHILFYFFRVLNAGEKGK